MASIAAYLSPAAPPDPTVLGRMFDAAPHRGSHRSVEIHGRCAIGVSVSDDVADASIATRDGITVAVCGRIDNVDELASMADGRRAKTPAEAVLTAFQASGDGAPNLLRGVFAGILTDGLSIKAFRDHIGFEPLFFRDEGAGVYVASEAKQVIAGAGIPREPDRTVVEGMFFGNYAQGTLSALRGVSRIPQASLFLAGPKGVRWERYWQPAHLVETLDLHPDELQLRFHDLMRQAATRVLTGDDVITLSGGIDSPAVAAYAAPEVRRRFGRRLAALSSTYPRFPRVDERPYVEVVAKELDLDLHLFEPRSRPFDNFRELIRLCDGPAPGTALAGLREVYVIAQGLGLRTILTGELAEYLIDAGQAHLMAHLLYRGRVSALWSLLRSQRARGVGFGSIGRQLARAALPGFLVDAYESRRDEPQWTDWLDRRTFEREAPDPVAPRLRWRRWQLGVTELPSWSFEADSISQAAAGVRVRRPWMDIDLWEFFLSLRAETKYPDVQPKKLLARRLLKGTVPDPILARQRKTVFDDSIMALIDYAFLRELLIDPDERIPGVDYERLAEHLRREDLTVRDFLRVRDLAAIHAFLES